MKVTSMLAFLLNYSQNVDLQNTKQEQKSMIRYVVIRCDAYSNATAVGDTTSKQLLVLLGQARIPYQAAGMFES
jgi:hypothetical protein